MDSGSSSLMYGQPQIGQRDALNRPNSGNTVIVPTPTGTSTHQIPAFPSHSNVLLAPQSHPHGRLQATSSDGSLPPHAYGSRYATAPMDSMHSLPVVGSQQGAPPARYSGYLSSQLSHQSFPPSYVVAVYPREQVASMPQGHLPVPCVPGYGESCHNAAHSDGRATASSVQHQLDTRNAHQSSAYLDGAAVVSADQPATTSCGGSVNGGESATSPYGRAQTSSIELTPPFMSRLQEISEKHGMPVNKFVTMTEEIFDAILRTLLSTAAGSCQQTGSVGTAGSQREKSQSAVTIRNFGRFELAKRKSRSIVHIKTGELIQIPEQMALVFRPATFVKQVLKRAGSPNDGDHGEDTSVSTPSSESATSKRKRRRVPEPGDDDDDVPGSPSE